MMEENAMSVVTLEQVADRAGVPRGLVDRLASLGVLSSAGAGFCSGDVHRTRFLVACEEAGIEPEAVARVMAVGRVSLSFFDMAHYRWSAVGTSTYGQLAVEMGLPLDAVLDLVRRLDTRDRCPTIGSAPTTAASSR
jgi:hypothetical protein